MEADLEKHLLVQVQPSRDCVQKTLKRLEERIQGRVLRQILYSLTSSNPLLQQRTAIALARLAREQDLRLIFVDRKGMDVLLSMLTDPSKSSEQHKEAAGAPQSSFTLQSLIGASQALFSRSPVGS